VAGLTGLSHVGLASPGVCPAAGYLLDGLFVFRRRVQGCYLSRSKGSGVAGEMIWRYSGALLALLVLVVVVFFAIEEVVLDAAPDLRRSSQSWGTYGDWAAGILPAGAVLLTAHMWLTDQRNRVVSGVRVEMRESGAWLLNESPSRIVMEPFAGLVGDPCIEPGDERRIDHNLTVEFADGLGVPWQIRPGKTLPRKA